MNFKPILWMLASLFLVACGDDTAATDPLTAAEPSNANAVVESAASSNQWQSMLTEDSICQMFSVSDLKGMFATENKVEVTASSFRSSFSCNYTWDKPDAESREKAMLENMMQAAQGKAERMSMRQKMPNNQLTITLQESKLTAERFMPPKLTEDQLQARIKSAKEMAAKRLSDEQQELAGDAANSMVEKLMQQNNQNEAVEGVGDAAYWSVIGGGGLNVLVGDKQLYVGPMIGETMAEDKQNAIKIARSMLQQ